MYVASDACEVMERLLTAQVITTFKSYVLLATVAGKFAETTVIVNVRVPKSPGSEIDAAFTEIVFAEKLMYAADGDKVVTVNGHTIIGYVTSTSVLMTTVCVEIATLGTLIVMLMRPAVVVSKTAVEHGSLIITSKFAVAVFPFTVAVRTSAYVLWFAFVAPFI